MNAQIPRDPDPKPVFPKDFEMTPVYVQLDPERFLKKAKECVAISWNEDLTAGHEDIVILDDLYGTWTVKVLQNNKFLVSTDKFNGIYWEVTYDGDKSRSYVDTYQKLKNVCITDEYLEQIRHTIK